MILSKTQNHAPAFSPGAYLLAKLQHLSIALAITFFTVQLTLKKAFCWDASTDPILDALKSFGENTKTFALQVGIIGFPVVAVIQILLLLFSFDQRKTKERIALLVGSTVAFIVLVLTTKQDLSSAIVGFLS